MVSSAQNALVLSKTELYAQRHEAQLLRMQLSDSDSASSFLQRTITSLEAQLQDAKLNSETRYAQFRNERRKRSRTEEKLMKSAADLVHLRTVDLPGAWKKIADASADLARLSESSQATILHLTRLVHTQELKISKLKKRLHSSQKKIQALKKRCKCAPEALAREISRMRHADAKKSSTFDLCRKGVVKKEVRQMARALVKAGCGQEHVSSVIKQVCMGVGVTVIGDISRRTVGRSILDGGVAADLQLAVEIKGTHSRHQSAPLLHVSKSTLIGLTASSDGTSEKHVNYESQHIAFTNPKSGSGHSNSKIATHVLRLFNVASSVDHLSETQVEGWKSRVNAISKLFNASPMSRRRNQTLFSSEFTRKLKGMNGDHAADQKKTFGLMGAWKRRIALYDLGCDKIRSSSIAEITQILTAANSAKIADIGGPEAWALLSEQEQNSHDVLMMEEVAISLGDSTFNALTDEEKHGLLLFVRAGCCMHKELNSVKGGTAAMAEWWPANNIPGPILLANRDNAATLEAIGDDSEALTTAESRALEVSGAGGVKATSLAGALFNHKDAKKGQQDYHRIFFPKVDFLASFPIPAVPGINRTVKLPPSC